MTHTELKEELRTQKIIYSHDFENPRAVRQAISELRKEGIIFIPSSIGKGIYVDINGASEAEVLDYYHAQERHFKTQYQNSLRPVKKWLEHRDKAQLMGRLDIKLKSDMQFKIGDIVVIFQKESGHYNAFKVGDVIRIEDIDQRDNTLYCMDVVRGLSQWVSMSEVKHAPIMGEIK